MARPKKKRANTSATVKDGDVNEHVGGALTYTRGNRPTDLILGGLVRISVCATHALVAYVRPGIEPADCVACERVAGRVSALAQQRSRSAMIRSAAASRARAGKGAA